MTAFEMTRKEVRLLQADLNALGFGPLVVDGLVGRNTAAAAQAFRASHGMPMYGPTDRRTLNATQSAILHAKVQPQKMTALSWMYEAVKMLGVQEQADNKRLRWWLRSGGGTVGDPARVPWCGDFVETCIALGLPNEPLPANPYLAASWALWGQIVTPRYGAVLSFWRGSPKSWKGHVGFCVGADSEAYHVLGGNQSDAVTVTRIAKGRLRAGGCRWPSTVEPSRKPEWHGSWKGALGSSLSTNES